MNPGKHHGRADRVNDIHPPVYYNSAMDRAARTSGETQGIH